MELKSNASESAIWRLTAGKGDRGPEGAGPLRKSGSVGSGDYSGAEKAGEPTSERKTAAGRIDFVLQVRTFWVHMVLAWSRLHKHKLDKAGQSWTNKFVQLPVHMSPDAKAQGRNAALPGRSSLDCCIATAIRNAGWLKTCNLSQHGAAT